MNNNQIVKINNFLLSHFEGHLSQKGVSNYSIIRRVSKADDGTIYAYHVPDMALAEKIDEIIYNGYEVGRRIKELGGDFIRIKSATKPTNSMVVSGENAITDSLIFDSDTRSSVIKKRKISSAPTLINQEAPPPLSPKKFSIAITNPNMFNNDGYNESEIKSINHAKENIIEWRGGNIHKLTGSGNEWSVDLINFKGQGRGKMRMLFTKSGNNVILTRIGNTHR